MTTYRNDQDAALARVDALEQENEQLAQEKEQLARDKEELAQEKEQLTRENEQLRVRSTPPEPQSLVTRPRHTAVAQPISTGGKVMVAVYLAAFIAMLVAYISGAI